MKNFIRVMQDFVCEHCGREVIGDGYTDHCPKCLWGKHVDEDIPGDRASECRGLMEPIGARYEKGKFKIKYRCLKCGHEFWVKAADVKSGGGQGKTEGDDREILIKLINNE